MEPFRDPTCSSTAFKRVGDDRRGRSALVFKNGVDFTAIQDSSAARNNLMYSSSALGDSLADHQLPLQQLFCIPVLPIGSKEVYHCSICSASISLAFSRPITNLTTSQQTGKPPPPAPPLLSQAKAILNSSKATLLSRKCSRCSLDTVVVDMEDRLSSSMVVNRRGSGSSLGAEGLRRGGIRRGKAMGAADDTRYVP